MDAEAGPGTRRHRFAGLEGVRGLAAAAVLVDHVGQHGSPDGPAQPLSSLLMLGSDGLTMFFVLSGFLLHRPFVAGVLGTEARPSIRRYLRARALRILPLHLVVLATAWLCGALVVRAADGLFDVGEIGRTSLAATVAAAALVSSLVPATVMTGIPPEWSLGAEVSFYLLLPVLGLLAGRLPAAWGPLRVLVAPALMIVAGAMVTAVLWGAIHGTPPAVHYRSEWGPTAEAVLARSMLGQAALFGLGMLAAVAHELRQQRRASPLTGATRALLVAVAALLALRGPLGDEFLDKQLVGVAAAIAVFLLVEVRPVGRPSTAVRVLGARPLRFLGDISYGIYLWHFPVLLWLLAHGLTRGGTAGVLLDVAMVSAITVGLAWVSHVLVERPAMRLRSRPSRPVPAAVAS